MEEEVGEEVEYLSPQSVSLKDPLHSIVLLDRVGLEEYL
jgi:hypothetical protein